MRQNTPSETNTFSGGALYSISATILSVVAKDSYVDARNMRYTEEDGNNLAMVKIKGEDLLYPAIDNSPGNYALPPISSNYFCMWAVRVAYHVFEIWCDETFAEAPFFRLDGKIVAMSADIPFSTLYPIQGDKNDGVGGEVFITDFNSAVHIYSIVSLFENAGYNGITGLNDGSQVANETYFDDYNDDFYVINIALPADHPIFKNCLSVSNPPEGATVIGDGEGLAAGSYAYYIRHKDSSGNAGNWSEASPIIPVPSSVGNDSTHIMGYIVKTLGEDEGVDTAYGIWIKFRVTNLLNYTAYELRRTRWDSPTLPYGANGVDELIYEGSIGAGEVSIVSIFDTGATGTALTVSEESQINVVEKAKTLRYFDQSLYLMNIEFASRVATATFVETPDVLYPVMYNMGAKGHYDPYNAVYYRSNMHLERYGSAIQYRDSYGARTFLLPITGTSALYPALGDFDNFEMPSRRDAALSASNINGLVAAADSGFNPATDTFETFEMVFSGNSSKTNPAIETHAISIGAYTPLHPTSETDFVNDQDYTPNLDSGDIAAYDVYDPQGFNIEYYSLGMRLAGIETMPSFVAAFTVMQRKANRVACQGIGMYAITPKPSAILGANKSLDTLWFYAPDVDNGFFDITDVMNNPSNYEVQIISAVGFHEEVYHGHSNTPDPDNLIDLVLYARILYEDGAVNVGDDTSTVGETGYVSHRKYRNTTTASVWAGYDEGNTIFDIDSVALKLTSPTSPNIRSTFYELTLADSPYAVASPTVGEDFTNPLVRNWHEPFYIVNILRKGAAVDTSTQQQTYYPTPAYVKVVSIVARQGDYGTTQAAAPGYPASGVERYRYELIDERWEDCCTEDATQFKYVYIRDLKGVEQAWLNVTYVSNADILTIATALISSGVYNGALSDNVAIYGIYTHEYQDDTPSTGSQANTYYLDFGFANGTYAGDYPNSLLAYPQYWTPTDDYLIVVRYNKDYPVNVFGGDCFVGENVFCPIDGYNEEPIAGEDYGSQFWLGVGMPYYNMLPQSGYDQISGGGVNLDYVRQMIVMFCCTSKANINWSFNGTTNGTTNFSYPKVHYIMQPILWDPADTCIENGVDGQYQTDYPDFFDEDDLPIGWYYGGFRFYQGIAATNRQYSQLNWNQIGVTAPTVNFTENTVFETGVIWSPRREIGVQDAPNLKTFPSANFRAINDKTGGIMKAFSALSGAGANLYAFTQGGICLLVTNKFVAQGADGQPISTILGQGATSIQQETWLSEEVGIPDELWRTFTEYGNIAFFINHESAFKFENNQVKDIGKHYFLARIYKDMIRLIKPQFYDHLTGVYDRFHDEFWILWRQQTVKLSSDTSYVLAPTVTINPHTVFLPNVPSVYDSLFYEVVGGTATNIFLPKTETGILSVIIRNTFTAGSLTMTTKDGNSSSNISGGSIAFGQTKSFTRASINHAWVVATLEEDSRENLQKFLFVFHDGDQPNWVGRFDYDHDRFVAVDNEMYGMKNAVTYTLGESGYDINDEALTAELLAAVIGKEGFGESKDFWYVRVNSNITPSREEFYGSIEEERSEQPQTYIDVFNNRGGFESYIPRTTTVPNGSIFTGDLMQLSVLLYKIVESSDEDFRVVSQQTWFRLIK